MEITFINKQISFHGGAFGAAVDFLLNEEWLGIFQQLMPKEYKVVSLKIERLKSKGFPSDEIAQTVLMFENNPVVAAYTTIQHMEDPKLKNIPLPAFEWDIYLPSSQEIQQKDVPLFEHLLIAHGSGLDSLLKMYLGKSVYQSILNLPRTELGGCLAPEWVVLYGKALHLGNKSNQNIDNLTISEAISYHKKFSKSETLDVVLDIKQGESQQMASLLHELEAFSIGVKFIGSFDISKYLHLNDRVPVLKFFHFAEEFILSLKDETVDFGSGVFFNGGCLLREALGIGRSRLAISSYFTQQSDHISTTTTQTTKVTYTKKPLFDRKETIGRFKEKKIKVPIYCESYDINHDLLDELSNSVINWRNKNPEKKLQIGIYVQESHIDFIAADMIAQIVNHKHDIFDLGFSWGTINGKITPHLLPTFSLKTIGKGSQELLDKSNYWRVVDFRTHIPE